MLKRERADNSTDPSKPTSEIQREILRMVGEKRSLPLESVASSIDEVRTLISRGYLGLVVAAYPWGVQFDVGISERGSSYLAESRARESDQGVKLP